LRSRLHGGGLELGRDGDLEHLEVGGVVEHAVADPGLLVHAVAGLERLADALEGGAHPALQHVHIR
jgi:hypothetical protein